MLLSDSTGQCPCINKTKLRQELLKMKPKIGPTNLVLLLFLLLTGVLAHSTLGTVLWTYDAGSVISSSPAITPDGAICFGTSSGLMAITNSGVTASNKWTFLASQEVSSSPAAGLDGTIYFLNPQAGCYALDRDGLVKWSYPFQTTGLSSPAIGADGTIYIVGDGSLYALTSVGAKKWSYDIGSSDGSPAIASDGTVYVTTGAGSSLYAINPDGTKKWAVIGGGSTTGESAALGGDGTIYFGYGTLAAYAPDGSLLWTSQSPTNNFDFSSPVIGIDGLIYAVDVTTRNLCAFSAGGQPLWVAPVGTGVRFGAPTAPAIDKLGNMYYCASNSVLALSPQGQVQWSLFGGAPPHMGGSSSVTSPAIGNDGTVYVALNTKLYAIAGTNTLANTPWPMFRQNARHTGKVEKPVLKQLQKRSDSNFQFQLYAEQLGLTYSIEMSTNLSSWTSLASVVATTLPTDVADLTATNAPFRFYRAVLHQ